VMEADDGNQSSSGNVEDPPAVVNSTSTREYSMLLLCSLSLQ
jgi:hypothetical protein